MPRTNKLVSNMVGGEISPLMHGRIDAPIYQKALAKMENFLALPQGGGQYRNGSVFVTNTRLNQSAFLMPFQFSDQQAYLVEVTAGKLRFYTNNGIVTGNDVPITGVTNANPAVVTSTAHGYVSGDRVLINNVGGMTQLNGNTYTVTLITADTYSIGVDSTAYGVYSSGGKSTQILSISAITNANPGVVTATHHQFSTGDSVFLSGTGTMLLDGQQYTVTVLSANTFSLSDLFGNVIDTTLLPAYAGGAFVQRIYEIANGYAAADIFNLQYAQSADTTYVVNQLYPPAKLIRKSSANWTFGTFTRTGTDPFPSAGNYPRAVSFDSAGRLWYGGTINNPQTIWGSSAPSAGNTAFDDFTGGTAATNSVQFTLAPLFVGKVDYIEWISNTNQFMVLGTFGSVRTLWGAAQGSPVTPTAVTSLPANVLGCAYTLPVANGDTLFYVQRGGQRVRSLEYDFYISGYTTKDQTIASDHLSQAGLSQIVQQRGYPDVMWGVRGDGKFLGFTYSRPEIENYASWHRHFLGGQYVNGSTTMPFAKVLSMAIAPRNQTSDQVWFSVQRTINGQTICSVEYMADYQQYPNRRDFVTTNPPPTAASQAGDDTRFANAMFETQKQAIYLDMANLYDGSALGRNANVSVTPSALGPVNTSITITASAAIFTASMVGQEIHKKYDLNGNGGGIARITGFTDSTHVTAKILSVFNNVTAISAGNWYLTAQTISGLNYLNGSTVSIVTDGGPSPSAVVSNGQIVLTAPATTVIVGFSYTGTIEYLNQDSGGRTGTAQSKPRNLIRSAIRFYNSLGVMFGTDYYRMQQITFRRGGFQMDRPTVPFTGIKSVQYLDKWSNNDVEVEKKVVLLQTFPLPCTILGVDNYFNTSDD